MANEELKQKDEYIFEAEVSTEMLMAKLQAAAENPPEISKTQKLAKPEQSTFEKVANSSVTKSIMRTAGNTIVRSLLGSLGLGGRTTRTTRRKGTNWF